MKCFRQIKHKLYSYLNDLKAPMKGEIVLWFMLFLVPFVSMMYGDAKAFTHYEVNFWGSIFEGGGIRNFYEYSNDMLKYYRENGIGGAYEVIYDFPVYVILGIWGFPLWLICKNLGIEETSNMWTMIYSKAIYFVALAIVAYIIYLICRNLDINKVQAKWASFLFVSSALVFVDIGMGGQLDILGFPFTLLGIYYYQKKCNWKFILFFAIAISFKQFPLFVFVPLLLLYEKNIVKIVLKIVSALSFTVLVGLPFPQNTEAMEVKAQIRERFMESFLGVKAPLFNSDVPIIVILIGVICIFCYLKKIETEDEWKDYSIFIPALVMFVLLISFDSNPYWFVHMAPFFAILLVYNAKKYNLLIMFEMIGVICLILAQYGANYWVFEPYYGRGMMLEKLFGNPEKLLTMQTASAYLRLDEFSGVLFAGFVLCMATVLYLSRPKYCVRDSEIVIRKYAVLRLVLNAAVSYLPVFLYIASCLFGYLGII